jgi:hypothetical protein
MRSTAFLSVVVMVIFAPGIAAPELSITVSRIGARHFLRQQIAWTHDSQISRIAA